jgi:hypothetical protein
LLPTGTLPARPQPDVSSALQRRPSITDTLEARAFAM